MLGWVGSGIVAIMKQRPSDGLAGMQTIAFMDIQLWDSQQSSLETTLHDDFCAKLLIL